MTADSNLEEASLGFFMQVQSIVKEKGLGLSDSCIREFIEKAKTSSPAKSSRAIAEVAELVNE